MLKHQTTLLGIPTLILSLLALSACERFPISIGDGIDGALDGSDDASGSAGTSSSGGAGGSPGTDPASGGSSSTGTGGAPSSGCEGTYLACLESGEWPEA